MIERYSEIKISPWMCYLQGDLITPALFCYKNKQNNVIVRGFMRISTLHFKCLLIFLSCLCLPSFTKEWSHLRPSPGNATQSMYWPQNRVMGTIYIYITSTCGTLTSPCGTLTSTCGTLTSTCCTLTSTCGTLTSTCGTLTSTCCTLTSTCCTLTSTCCTLTSTCCTLT